LTPRSQQLLPLLLPLLLQRVSSAI